MKIEVHSLAHTVHSSLQRSVLFAGLIAGAALFSGWVLFASPGAPPHIPLQQDVTSRLPQQDPRFRSPQDTTSKDSAFRIPMRPVLDSYGRPLLDQMGQPLMEVDSLKLDSLRLAVARLDSIRRDSIRADSIAVRRALRLDDSTYVVCLDSSARLRQFVYRRKDYQTVQLFPRRTHPLFAQSRPAQFRREMAIDSVGERVLLRETLGGEDVRIPQGLGLREYLSARMKSEWRSGLAQIARQPRMLGSKDELGQLLSNITQITIPIPANPLFNIFGKPEISLNIGGSVDIKAGFRNTKSDQTTISRLDQSRNEPDFSQEVQVNVSGTIGDKLNILADWNTKRTFEYENQLKIKYTGYDDEIVQSVEAGNVSLSTPSAFVGSSQALFGVKAKFQMGPLTLTTIASQKKGQIKEVAVSGGAKEQSFEFKAYEYATNHYFVDTSYAKYYERYYNTEPAEVNASSQIVEEEVWIQRQGQVTEGTDRQAIAYIDIPDRPANGYPESLRDVGNLRGGEIETGPMLKLDRSQYELDGDGYLGVVSINANVNDALIVGIAYRTADGRQYGELVRDVSPDVGQGARPLILKLLKPKDLLSQGRKYPVAWAQLLKNIYPIPGIGRNLKKEGFALDIYRSIPGSQEVNNLFNEPLLRAFGLDRFTVDGAPAPAGDGVFDFRPGRSINLNRAEIIFPSLRPFDTWLAAYYASKGNPLDPSSEYVYPEIYDTTQTFAQQSIRNRWLMRGKAAGEATSRYSLGFNVVEGSVQVILDGRQLTQNMDYTVDYIIGEVIIKNDKALVPGANLQIKYEQNDLFQLASKTLLGARGDVSITPQTNFGFTVMNLNQQSLSDKVRLGEEPNNNTIFGVDGSTLIDLPILTRALDALPFLQTKEASSLKFSAEAAYMLPDPNTRKSPISSDNGEGIAYIDDFEGARRTTPVGIIYTAWSQASPPADPLWQFPDSVKMGAKGRLIWYNKLPTDVRLTQIYPNKRPGNLQNDQATVLDLHYFPAQRGQFNYNRNLSASLRPDRNWGGVMKPLSLSALNLTKENINFIELWVRMDKVPAGAKLVIDLGTISEDAIANRALNSEDLILSSTPNGVLQEGEDRGLDMLTDDEERSRFSDLVALYPELAEDPSGDNYWFSNQNIDAPGSFDRINGTQGNRDGPGGRIPDTEDLNNNGVVDLANSYFEYEVPLIPDPSRNPFIVGGGSGESVPPWYQLRIAVDQAVRTVGSPTLESIEYARLLFINASDTVILRIADFNLVGNQWQKQSADQKDTSFAITVVNVEDNLSYRSPPGVIRERDKTRPEEDVLANEQSLAIQLKGLRDGESRQGMKFYTYRALDLFSYRTMKMFVHGDPKWRYVDPTNYDAEFFFRFGGDSLNYYEYRAPVHPADASLPAELNGWDPLNDVVIRFEDLTALKQGRDSIQIPTRPVPVPGGPPGAVYRVRGNPSLTQIVYMSIGVENPAGKGTPAPLVGELWVNELRLTSVDDTPGWAYRFDSQLKMADLGSVAFNYSRVDPNFHSLEQRFGSRMNTTNWGVSTNVQLERLLPESMVGSQLGVSYSHTEGLTEPKYLANSDVLVSKAADLARQQMVDGGATETAANARAAEIVRESETKRVTDTYAAPNLRILIPSNAWYIRDTFNKLTFGFNYTKSSERSPGVVYRESWAWSARVNYAHTFSPDYFIEPFRSLFDGVWLLDEYKTLRIYYTPQNLSWGFSANRSRDNSLQRTAGAREIITRNFSASRNIGFGWKLTENGLLNPSGDYSLSVESSLLDLETDASGRQRPFSAILSDIFGGSRLINFGQDTRYSQRNSFNTKPMIPNLFNIRRFLDVSFSYQVDYAWQNALTRGDLGKSAGFNNNINLTVNLRLKPLFDPLFQESATAPAPTPPGGRGRRGDSGVQPSDTTTAAPPDTATGPSGLAKTLAQLKNIARIIIKIPFLDYDNINVTFSQSNSSQNSGIIGGPGFLNFWGRVPFFQESDPASGPTRLYQLGLISDPSGQLTNFRFRGSFPFFGWDVVPGLRAPGGVLMNSYRQTNRISLKTSRGLWEGARLDLNWNLNWTYARTQNLNTDSLGVPIIATNSITGNVERSYLSFPDFLVFGMLKSNMKEVSRIYGELKNNRSDARSDDEKLNQAFEEGFEALPFFRKVFGQYAPRVNWNFRWDGLEKLPFFSNFASRVSLDHAYTSSFSRTFQNRQGGGGERTDGQRITYGFAPLLGLNLTFKELLKGSFGANLRFNSTVGYDLATSSRNLVENSNQEISLTASYNRRGFEIPLFGLSLNNDIDISFSYSYRKTSRLTYELSKFESSPEGTPLEGQSQTVLEPRIKYILSSRVTASLYYRHSKTAPDNAGSRIPGITTNEAGLDLHIAIHQ